MKKGWTYKKLGEVARFSRGLTYSKHDEVDSSENVVLRSNNIDLLSGKLDFSEMKYLKSEFSIPDDKRLKKGSLFICMSNGSKSHLGKVAYIDKNYNYAFGGFMGQITPDDSINGRFLHYALCSPMYKDYIKSLSSGANINNLKYKDLELFEINIAPLSEQKSIVERLDSAFAHIDELKTNAEKQLAEARALFQKSLAKAMEPKEGWEEKKLKEITSSIGDGLHGTPKYSDEGKYYFVNGNNFEDGIIDIKENTKRVDSDEYDKYKIHLDETTVLLSINGTIGKTAFYNGEPIILGKSACYINVLPSLSKEYLRYFLLSDNFIEYAKHNSRQATIVNLGLKEIRTMPISFPPLSEQQRIVERLDSISENVRKYEEIKQKIIAECDALKQALLRQVFE